MKGSAFKKMKVFNKKGTSSAAELNSRRRTMIKELKRRKLNYSEEKRLRAREK